MGAKHQKTRKEKVIADYRHQVYKPTLPTIAGENFYLNTHVLGDVLRTGILTLSIIAAQIILFFLLKKHLITLPMLKY